MAGFGFPPTGAPGAVRPAQPGPTGGGFTDVLKAPEVQAALIQFGVNMLTPSYSGFGAQIGKSLGQAGAAAGRASAQRQAEEEKARNRELQEREFGLSKRRVDLSEREVARREKQGTGSRDLQSMFTKPKSFQQFLAEEAERAAEATFGDKLPQDFSHDPVFREKTLRLWRETANVGVAADGTSEPSDQPSPERVLTEAREALAKRPDKREAIIARVRELGVDPGGL